MHTLQPAMRRTAALPGTREQQREAGGPGSPHLAQPAGWQRAGAPPGPAHAGCQCQRMQHVRASAPCLAQSPRPESLLAAAVLAPLRNSASLHPSGQRTQHVQARACLARPARVRGRGDDRPGALPAVVAGRGGLRALILMPSALKLHVKLHRQRGVHSFEQRPHSQGPCPVTSLAYQGCLALERLARSRASAP